MTPQYPLSNPPAWTAQQNAPAASSQFWTYNPASVSYPTYSTDPSMRRPLTNAPAGPIHVQAYEDFLKQVGPRFTSNPSQNTVANTALPASLAPAIQEAPVSVQNVSHSPAQMASRTVTKDGESKIYHLYNRNRLGSVLCSHSFHPPGYLHWVKEGEAFVTSTDRTCRYSADCWASCAFDTETGRYDYIPHASPWTLEDVQAGIDRTPGCEGMSVGLVSVPRFQPKACPRQVHSAIELNSFRKDGWYWGADGDSEAKDILCTSHMSKETGLKDPSWLVGARDCSTGLTM